MESASTARVVAVAKHDRHRLAKDVQTVISLATGLGVEGDVHAGVLIQHAARVLKDPTQPNLRQVHLLPAELLEQFAREGIDVSPGEMGENVLTRGIDLLALPTGARLRLGEHAGVRVTGLRNPCRQLDAVAPSLLGKVLTRSDTGEFVRLAGIMSVVQRSGKVRPGDLIRLTLPDPPFMRLSPV